MNRLAMLVAMAWACPSAIAFHTYSITDVGDLPGGADFSFAQDINDNGVVSGVGTGANGSVPFRWTSSQGLTPLPLLAGFTQANSGTIDSLGNITGVAYTIDPLTDGHPVRWSSQNQLTDVGVPAGMTWAIADAGNDHGVIAGWGQTANGRRGFTWSATAGFTVYQPLAGDSECGFCDISNSGIVCGWSGDFAAFWKNGTGGYLAKPQGGVLSFPNLITDEDRICGYVGLSDGTYIAGSWTTTGRFTQEDQLSGYPSMDCVWATHDGSTLVGAAYDSDYERATLFNALDGVVDLNALVDPSTPGWTLQLATSSNRFGQIVGSGLIDGKTHGFIATPVVTPTKVNVLLGKATEGGLQSLEAADGNGLTVCKFLVPNQQAAPVTVELDALSPVQTPSNYFIRLVSKVNTSGVLSQTVDLYDWSSSSYADTRTDTLNTSFKTVELQATGDLSRYVGPERALRARFRVKATGPVGSSLWCAVLDCAQFVTRP